MHYKSVYSVGCSINHTYMHGPLMALNRTFTYVGNAVFCLSECHISWKYIISWGSAICLVEMLCLLQTTGDVL